MCRNGEDVDPMTASKCPRYQNELPELAENARGTMIPTLLTDFGPLFPRFGDHTVVGEQRLGNAICN
jgi:hypothetical protein